MVDYFSALGSPDENGSIERTNDARVFLGKIDWQLSPKHLATLRYNYTWAEQKNGTFDVDSWGVSANAVEKDDSHAVTGSLISNLSGSLLNEFRFQWARENRPRPYDGPNISGQSRPLPDTAFDFGRAYRFGEPFFIPVDYFDERIQFNDNISVIKGRHSIKFGVEYNRVHSNQTFLGFAERPLHLRLHRRLPELRAQPEATSSARTAPPRRRAPARPAPTSPARCCCSCSSSASAGSRPRRPARRTSRRPSSRSSRRTSGSRTAA